MVLGKKQTVQVIEELLRQEFIFAHLGEWSITKKGIAAYDEYLANLSINSSKEKS